MCDVGTLLGVGGSCFAMGMALTNLVWTLLTRYEHKRKIRKTGEKKS